MQFKLPASARLPLELRGDEGERKYKMAHLYSWTILSKTNTGFTDYTCNSCVNFCNTTVKSHVSKPINLCKCWCFLYIRVDSHSLPFPAGWPFGLQFVSFHFYEANFWWTNKLSVQIGCFFSCNMTVRECFCSSLSKERPLKEAQRSLDLMVQVSLSLIKKCLMGLKSRQSGALA